MATQGKRTDHCKDDSKLEMPVIDRIEMLIPLIDQDQVNAIKMVSAVEIRVTQRATILIDGFAHISHSRYTKKSALPKAVANAKDKARLTPSGWDSSNHGYSKYIASTSDPLQSPTTRKRNAFHEGKVLAMKFCGSPRLPL